MVVLETDVLATVLLTEEAVLAWSTEWAPALVVTCYNSIYYALFKVSLCVTEDKWYVKI